MPAPRRPDADLARHVAVSLAKFERPTKWWRRRAPLPTGPSGKILRREVRDQWLAQCPIHGNANVRENSAPYASMIVSSSTMKPQNVAACAAPGMFHFSSFRYPITSVSWGFRSPPRCVLAYRSRSGAC